MTEDVKQILAAGGCTLSLPAGESREFIIKDHETDNKQVYLLLKAGTQIMLMGVCQRAELKRVTRGL
jgi:hypothetical protein